MGNKQPLHELCTAIVDCPHSTPKWTESGLTVLRSHNIRGGRLDLSDRSYTDEEHFADRIRRAVPEGGDLVITREAPMGEVCEIPTGLRCCLGQRMVLIKPNKSKVVPRYLLFALQSPYVQHHIKMNEGTGSTVSNLRIPLLEALPIPTPSLAVQIRIADILGTLDDKIELNRRTNETLEAMAKALFKSWFVDFDPVHDKAAGRQPAGLDAATAKLFPDSFVDSPLGKIPKGWRVGTFGEIAENPRRGIQPNEIKAGTAYIGLEHMPRRCIALSEWEETADLESNKFQFNHGEILFGKLRPYFHKVGIAAVDGVCSTDILVLTASTPAWFGLLLGHVSSDEFVAHTDAASGGTKMPRTSWGDMARYSIVMPTVDVGSKFTELLRPLVSRIETNIHESRTLATTRDALLPKLLSGELAVGEVG